MKRREAAGLLLVTPTVAFGTQANSAVAIGVIGTGNRGQYDAGFFAKDPRA